MVLSGCSLHPIVIRRTNKNPHQVLSRRPSYRHAKRLCIPIQTARIITSGSSNKIYARYHRKSAQRVVHKRPGNICSAPNFEASLKNPKYFIPALIRSIANGSIAAFRRRFARNRVSSTLVIDLYYWHVLYTVEGSEICDTAHQP